MSKFILLLVCLAAVVIFFLLSKGIIKSPILLPAPDDQKAELKTLYKNPFDPKSQYINPLNEYKNPFDVIRADEQNQ